MGCDFPTKKTEICPPYTLEQIDRIVHDLFPNGNVWMAKYVEEARLFKFIEARNIELLNLYNRTFLICEDFDPAFTVFLLERWERLLGLPDDCLPPGETIEQRRFFVLLKLAGMNVVNEQDYIDLAACLGFTIEITYPDVSGQSFPYTFPFTLGQSFDDIYTVCIKIIFDEPLAGFSYNFPFFFEIPQNFNIIICLFNKLKPAHIFFKYETQSPPVPPPLSQDISITLDNGNILTLDNGNIVTTDFDNV